jgi:hypothetical protein
MLDTASSKSVSEGEGDDIPTHSDDRQGAAGKEEKFLSQQNRPLQIKGPL